MQPNQQHPQDNGTHSQGLFAKQEDELVNAYEKLKKSVRNKITKINNGTLVLSEKDTAKTNNIKKKLDDKVEGLHLAVSNYFGDCDKRKQRIEAEISEKVDFNDFGRIAETLLNL